MTADLASVCVPAAATIEGVMRAIDASGVMVAILIDADGRLAGLVTDGDVRRALLAGVPLSAPVAPYMTDKPVTVPPDAARADVLELMHARTIEHVPVVDADGRVTGLHLLRDVLRREQRANAAVIMAGGRGTRLEGLARDVPKPMLRVAGRPILERLVLHLAGSGIRSIHIAVNHLAPVVEDHFGDGSDFGCTVSYLRESPDRPLGTAGALTLLQPPPDRALLLLNGDLVTQFSVDDVFARHAQAGAAATVAVRPYVHEVPFGVAALDREGLLRDLDEKPVQTWTVNAGVYVLEPRLVGLLRPDQPCDAPVLIRRALDAGERVAAWELTGDWIDVGRPAHLRKARGER